MRKKKIRAYSATDEEAAMLTALAEYHHSTKSATLVGLIKKEFWRVFPGGTDTIIPTAGARVTPEAREDES